MKPNSDKKTVARGERKETVNYFEKLFGTTQVMSLWEKDKSKRYFTSVLLS